jgi:hypothetical protein
MSLFSREEPKKRTLEEMMHPIQEEGDIVEEAERSCEETLKKEEVEGKDENVALSCFGSREDKTEKWIIKCTQVWYAVMSFFWFLFGALTFAPIIFISKKVNVIFKSKAISLLVSAVIWCAFVLLIIVLASRNTKEAEEIVKLAEIQQKNSF